MKCWLLFAIEGFDKGQTSEEAIENANKFFAESWFIDKIINTEHNKLL